MSLCTTLYQYDRSGLMNFGAGHLTNVLFFLSTFLAVLACFACNFPVQERYFDNFRSDGAS